RPGDLVVCDGTLTVRAPVEGAAGEPELEAAALAATVEEACADGAAPSYARRPRRTPVVLAAACALIAVVLGLAHGPGSPAHAPRAPAAQAASLPPLPPVDPLTAPAPPPSVIPPRAAARPPARVHRHLPRRRHRPARHRRPRPRAPHAAPRRPSRPVASLRPRRHREGGIAPAGGHA